MWLPGYFAECAAGAYVGDGHKSVNGCGRRKAICEIQSQSQSRSVNVIGRSAFQRYEDVGFLSQQTTSSAQNQIDLQESIWNVFAPGTYAVTSGMQAYLSLLSTPTFTNFDFGTVRFLEDADQGPGQAQAFVIDPPDAPEPATLVMMGGALLLCGLGKLKRSKRR